MDTYLTPIDGEPADQAALAARIAQLESALADQTRRVEALEQAATRANQAAETAQTYLDTLLAIIPTGIALFDEELRFVGVNPLLAAVDGREPDSYAGLTPAELQADFARFFEPLLRKVLDTGHPVLDLALQGATSSTPPAVRDWLASVYPILGADRRRLGVAVVVREETERLRAAHALRERDERLHHVLVAADCGTWHHDLAAGTVTLDERARAHFGLVEETVSAPDLWAFVHPDDGPRVARAMIVTPDPVSSDHTSLELRVVDPDGTERWLALHIRVSPAFGEATGQPEVVTGLSQDITTRKVAEIALRAAHMQIEQDARAVAEQAALLDTLITRAPIGIAYLDCERHIRHINAEMAAMNGLTPAEHMGRPIGEVLPALATQFDAVLKQILTTGEPVLQQEVVGETAADPEVTHTWLGSFYPVRAPEGNMLGVGAIVQDVTEHRRVELTLQLHAEALSHTNAELARALRLKDEFLAMMSHELRTPLNAILGISESLLDELYGPLSDRQRRALAQVTEGGEHLLAILSDILDLTRIEAGAEQLEPEVVSIERLCRNSLQLIATRAQKKELRLLHSFAFGVEALRADERRLTQILVNLLDNAVKFTPTGGTVGLEVDGDALLEQISFTVWDTGIGIAPENMDRLFKPFTQVDGRLARSYSGIGLGLTLVQRLTELHGGSVQLATIPGVGSRFTILLPWSPDDNIKPLAPVSRASESSWSRPIHVLVADDHESTLELYTAQVNRLGGVVTVARTGTEALAQIQAQRPDVVLLDIQMPELDGLSVIRRVRADPPVAATPIIAVTALAMPGDRERCLAAGATRYLAKPVNSHTLLATIAEVLPDEARIEVGGGLTTAP